MLHVCVCVWKKKKKKGRWRRTFRWELSLSLSFLKPPFIFYYTEPMTGARTDEEMQWNVFFKKEEEEEEGERETREEMIATHHSILNRCNSQNEKGKNKKLFTRFTRQI